MALCRGRTDMNDKREKLPKKFEEKYKSEQLKEKIANPSMWFLIPGVSGTVSDRNGLRRLNENDLLFSFIDEYFPDDPFEFEPNMKDGRFVMLPKQVDHQGMGILVSRDLPGFLEIGHFWYPGEYAKKKIAIGPFTQIYVPIFQMKPGPKLAAMVREIYFPEKPRKTKLCTFPFAENITVTLKGDFLDNMKSTEKKIRDVLKNQPDMIQRNGEGLIHFMKKITGNTAS